MTPRSSTDEPPPPAAGTRVFGSLRIRNFRLFALGQAVSNTGGWVQRVAQDWLVLTMTGSSTAVGITIALQFLPTLLLGLYGGVLADRYPKRTILLVTQSAMAVTSIVLGVLTLTGQVTVWHVYLLALVLGLVTVADTPARQSFVSEMVGPEYLRDAVSLNATSFSLARLIGPAIAAALILSVGIGWAFLANGLSFLAILAGLAAMRTADLHRVDPQPRGPGQLREGLRYVRHRPDLLWPIVLVGFLGTFGFNFPVWFTAFTDHVFQRDADGYGLLNVLIAAGSVAGALIAGRWPGSRIRLLVGGAAAYGAVVITTAAMPSFWLLAALTLVIGLLAQTFNTAANSHLQLSSEPHVRGRVMSLYVIVFTGGWPIGGPVIGGITDAFGARIGMMTSGVIVLTAAVVVGVLHTRHSRS